LNENYHNELKPENLINTLNSFRIQNNQVYSIKNLITGFLIDTYKMKSYFIGGSEFYKNNSETGHILKLINSFENVYVIKDLETNFQLDSNENGLVYLHAANVGNYQKWKVINLYANIFKLQNMATGLYLAMEINARSILTQKENANSNQNWQFLLN